MDEHQRDVIDVARPEDAAPEPAPSAPPSGASDAATQNANDTSIPQDELDDITEKLVAALKTVYDPEIPVDIYELGLIYKVDIDDDRVVTVDMTLTAPGCPVAEEMPGWVQQAVMTVPGIMDAKINMTFDPPWTPDRMSDEAKLQLNMF